MQPLMAPIKEEGDESPDENVVIPDATPSSNFHNNIRNDPSSGVAKRSNHPSMAMGDQEDPVVIDEEIDPPEIIELDEGESIFVTPDEVAQAFSHFSYVHGGRAVLICDLQGVLINKIDNSTDSGYRKVLQLTDPAIHYHHTSQDAEDNTYGGTKKYKARYGRTDRGEKGMEDFLATHVCNGLCPLVTKGFFSAPPSDRSKGTTDATNQSYCQPAGFLSVEPMNETP
jgi:hypothetical protein